MVFKCIVPGCRGNYEKDGPKVSTFIFPKDPELQRKWISAIGIPRDFNVTNSSRVCELHFAEGDIRRTFEVICPRTMEKMTERMDRPRIKKDAVPSIFMGCPKYLSTKKTTREDPEMKKRKFEHSQLESAIAESLQSYENHFEKFKIDSLNELKEKLKMDEPRAESSSDFPEISSDNVENTTVKWKFEKVEKYILSKIESLMQDPNHNPLIAMKKNVTTVSEEMQQLCDKYLKLQKSVEQMGREQLLFLSRIGVEPRINSLDVGVGVDLPPLPEAEPFSYGYNASVKGKTTTVSKPIVKKTCGPVECIDLTCDEDPPPQPSTNSSEKEQVVTSSSTISTPAGQYAVSNQGNHPAPLPSVNLQGQNPASIPPKPVLKISVAKNGIVLQWDMPPEAKSLNITNFEIYGYQEKSNVSASSSQWERIGFVHAMPLPMSCTLTQFVQGCKYHFSIRATTSDYKLGHFSDPASIMFVTDPKKK